MTTSAPSLKRIHHVAYRCKDAKETVEWYSRVLGMEYTTAFAEDKVPSTGEDDPYTPLGTDDQKPYLETAPWIIAIFGQRKGGIRKGIERQNYYVPESVGIAMGFLISALHHAGVATLTDAASTAHYDALTRQLPSPV